MGLHGLAAAAVWLSSLTPGLAVGATALIGLSQIREWRRWSRPSGALCYVQGHGWSLDREGADPVAVEILPSTVVTPWVVWVDARSQAADHTWTLSSGHGDADSFRRLRVCLRVAALPPSAVPARPLLRSKHDGST